MTHGLRPVWIATPDALADAVASAPPGAQGFDTEFIRVRTFYPQPALYQLVVADRVLLIDPLALDVAALQPLAARIARADVELVMHACSEDLELLRHHLGVLPGALFDTQIAAALVFPEPALGYAALVKRMLDIDVDKSETRSDWRQRPLSGAQLRYAVVDVAHLDALRDRLSARLDAMGRSTWLRDEVALQLRGAATDRDPALYFLGVRDARRLSPHALALLRDLCAWRERTARVRDRPRAHVVPDPVLYEIARSNARTSTQIAHLLQPPLSQKWAPELADVIAASAAAEHGVDADLLESAEPGALRAALQRVRPRVVELAERLGVSEGIVGSRRLLEMLLQQWNGDETVLPAEWSGWRRDVVLPVLRSQMRVLPRVRGDGSPVSRERGGQGA